ncbi:MAG: sugar transferase [Candidatus Alcyoniella australis]|nr:sugar transferase [Candidatus Alcyoniella australis]
MRLLYIDQYFSTHDGVSGTRSFDLASRMVAQGHEVTLLTSASRYWMPGGGRGLIRRQRIAGIDVVVLGVDYAPQMGALRRAWAFGLFSVAGSLIAPLLGRFDAVFSSSTPLSVGLPGVLGARLLGVPHVFEVRDLWPAVPAALGALGPGIVLGAAKKLERWIYANSARLVALSPGMAQGIQRCGVDPRRIEQIPNTCNTELFANAEPNEAFTGPDLQSKQVVLYAGAMGAANGLDALLDLALQFKDQGNDNALFVLAGDGPQRQRLENRARALELGNVRFVGPLPRSAMPAMFAASAVTLTLFADNTALNDNSPNKLFDSLAAGRPSLVNRPGWTEQLLNEAGAGFRLPTEDPPLAAQMLVKLLDDQQRLESMGRSAANLAAGELNVERAAQRLEAQLQRAIAGNVQRRIQLVIKGVLDRLLAAAGLAVLWPLLLAIALAIRIESPGPALFRLQRAGRYGFAFRPLKFRTMISGAAAMGAGLNVEHDDQRITRVGRVLRRLSLDELPQLIDVLCGSMSLVGPRPMLIEQAASLDQRQQRRLELRPGISGWAQVNGRNALSWTQRIERDLEYVERFSLLMDLRILLRTVRVALAGEGLYEAQAGADDPFNRFEGRDD